MRRMTRQVVLALVVGVAAFGLAACAERAVEEAIEAESGGEVDVDADADTLTIRGEDGEEMRFSGGEGGVDLPDDFPSTIPIYPDALPVQYANMGDAVQAGFQVDAAFEDVRDWYVEELEDKGWEIQMNMAVPDGAMVTAELDGESLSLMMGTDDDGETTIIVTLGGS